MAALRNSVWGASHKPKGDLTFMKKDESMLPSTLLDVLPSLPCQTHGVGLFTPWGEAPVEVKCAEGSIPVRKTAGAAGYDLVSACSVTIAAGSSGLVQTGVYISIPTGYFGKIEGRSSLGIRHSVVPFQGVIDSDYRGPIVVKLFNHARTKYRVAKGDRVAQLVLMPCYTPPLMRVDELSATNRGERGFGSTGK